jgi:DNA-binding NarL/FixJ family response regulator
MRRAVRRESIRIVSPTVLIVDDHEGFRRSVRALLEAGGFEVVGEVVDGGSAMAAAARLRPEFVLLDVQLPDVDGFEVAERLASEVDPPTIVLTSTRGASSYRRQLAGTAASGFVAKEELSAESLLHFVR